MASTVGRQASSRLTKLAAEIRGAERHAVNAAALEMKRAVDREIGRVAPRRRMRNVGKRGARVGVRYDIKGTRNPTALIRATGPLHLLERKTQPHTIYVRAARARGRGSSRLNTGRRLAQVFGGRGAYGWGALTMPDGQYRRVVSHPGTSGKRPWAKGVAAGRPRALKALRDANTAAVRRGFK
jgi:hypothetical protein